VLIAESIFNELVDVILSIYHKEYASNQTFMGSFAKLSQGGEGGGDWVDFHPFEKNLFKKLLGILC